MKPQQKKPLYRKVNTKARGVHHNFGGDYRNQRNTKNPDRIGMKKGVRRGLDYTPLYRFLLSKVGSSWDDVYKEAVSRLDRKEPIFSLVSDHKDEDCKIIGLGESTFYSGLYVDEDGILQIIAPEIGLEELEPLCSCCTHTLNGKVFTRKYKEGNQSIFSKT